MIYKIISRLLLLALIIFNFLLYFGYIDILPNQINHKATEKCQYNNKQYVCHFYWYGAIQNRSQYESSVNLLEKLRANDKVYIHLNSPGGSTSVLFYLQDKIQKSKANIIMQQDGWVASAAAILLLSGDKIIIKSNEKILFHLSKSSISEAKREYCSTLISRFECLWKKSIDEKILRYMTNVLNKDELKNIFEGKDVILTGYELAERIKKYHANY